MAEMLNLDRLPTETLVSIFTNLRGRDLYSVKNTCHRFGEIFDKFKLNMLPWIANGVEIKGVPRFHQADHAVNYEATLRIKYPGKKRSSLHYKIRTASEDEKLQQLPRAEEAEKYDCLEDDGVLFYKPEPLKTHIHVIAHTSVLDTIVNILNKKVDQPYLRKFSCTELKFTEKFCVDLKKWTKSTGVKFGAVEYIRCKINCEARHFTPLICALKEIKLDDCKCNYGSPNLFEGEELKNRLSKVDKLHLKPFVTNHRLIEAEQEIHRERYAEDNPEPFLDIADIAALQQPDGGWPILPFLQHPIPGLPVRPVGAIGFNPNEEDDDFDVEEFRENLRIEAEAEHFENEDADEDDFPNVEHVEPGVLRHAAVPRRMDRDDEPNDDPDADNEVDPFMNFGAAELFSTTAKKLFWGSHSTLSEEDAVQFVNELLEGSRVIQKFTLEHRRYATDRAVRIFCDQHFEKLDEKHYKFKSHTGQQYYVHFHTISFKIQTKRFK